MEEIDPLEGAFAFLSMEERELFEQLTIRYGECLLRFKDAARDFWEFVDARPAVRFDLNTYWWNLKVGRPRASLLRSLESCGGTLEAEDASPAPPD